MEKAKRRPFTARYKLDAIQLAKEKGNRAAGREYGIDESVIRRWRANEEKLRSFPEDKKANRGHSSHHPQLEQDLVSWIKSLQESGKDISTEQIRRKALDMAKVIQIIGFFASPHWCWRFLRRHKLSICRRKSVSHKLPENWKKKSLQVRHKVPSSTGQKRKEKIQELEEKLKQVTKECNKYKKRYFRLLKQQKLQTTNVENVSPGDADTRRMLQGLPLSNCPPPREHALQDWTSQGQAVTVGVNPQQPLISEHQSLEEDPHLVRIKEEGPTDEFWSQEAGPVRFDTTVAENTREHLQLSQEPVQFRELELKAEPQEVRVAQGDSMEHKQTHSSAEDSRWTPLTKEEEVGAREEAEHLLPFLPQVEQAFGYFHSNPISPEHQPEAPLTPPLPLGPGTSKAFSVSMGTNMAYVAPPMPRQGRGMARRPIVCPVCQKHLLAPSELTKHMRSHTGERPYACGICGVHFAQKSSLKTHERLHSGLRPYRCSHCGKDYTLSHHLKRHMRSHFRECGGASQPNMQLQGP
ncbi:hypothetical protein AALO_G00005910 [Alosa alosa]|uniref:Uncharacterized protein n=1 Tax=Alosa alosa TaxID=278164 RepID=A0AAV6HJC5_9TELE|nr:zinc finger protein 768-like isoform X1 [Alosa alosa]KAG5285656.1 hypothetical protein AALO_G00005910 [Alosa alosa]